MKILFYLLALLLFLFTLSLSSKNIKKQTFNIRQTERITPKKHSKAAENMFREIVKDTTITINLDTLFIVFSKQNYSVFASSSRTTQIVIDNSTKSLVKVSFRQGDFWVSFVK